MTGSDRFAAGIAGECPAALLGMGGKAIPFAERKATKKRNEPRQG